MLFGKNSSLRVTEEQTAEDFSHTRDHRRGQIAPDGQMTFWHAPVGDVPAVTAVFGDVIGTDDALAPESRAEHLSVSGHRELREGLMRSAGERIKEITFPRRVRNVVKERAEFSTQ